MLFNLVGADGVYYRRTSELIRESLRISESLGISRTEYLEFADGINRKCGGYLPDEMTACVGKEARERGFPFPQ